MMALWKITSDGPTKVRETTPQHEKLLEESLEEWIASNPSLLGEPLMVLGRQVMIPDVKDRLDILALDPQGNAVIVELKRGKLSDPVDMQALRYASYISKWSYPDFENQARAYLGKSGDPDFNFNETFEQFCADCGVDEAPDINTDQRMVIVGSEVRDKLGSVALWLRDRGVDIKVIEVELFRDGDTLLLEPRVIIPLPVSKFAETGKRSSPGVSQPWLSDGKTWHLEKRCSRQTRGMLIKLDDMIHDSYEVDGPRWDQKNYVAYRIDSYNWLAVVTRPTALMLIFDHVRSGAFTQARLAQDLGVQEFEGDSPLSERLALPSSVQVKPRNEGTDRVFLRVKEGFDLESEAFLGFLGKAYKAFSRKAL